MQGRERRRECPGDDGDETVFKEDESEEEVWSGSDDEDIHQLVQTLQSYVEESSKSHQSLIRIPTSHTFIYLSQNLQELFSLLLTV